MSAMFFRLGRRTGANLPAYPVFLPTLPIPVRQTERVLCPAVRIDTPPVNPFRLAFDH